jgi:hypothetical protein
VVATYEVRVSWRGNNLFTDTGDAVDVRPDVTISYGRDQSRALSPIAMGTATLELNNLTRDYSPENTSSPLNGFILPARPLKITAILSGSPFVLFRGHFDDYVVQPAPNERKVSITALDGLAKLREAKGTTELFPALRTGEAIGKILDSIGWPAADRDLDIGATTVRWWSIDDDEAWSSILELVSAEGPPSLVTVDPDGKIVFRDRHHRLLRTESVTSQATFRDTGTEPLFSAPLTYDQGWKDVFNAVALSVDERDPEPELSDLWTSDLSYSINSGSTYTITFQTSDPFYGAIPPVAGTDYQLRSGSATVTLSRTSGQSTTISILASGATVIDTLKVRGYPVTVSRTVQIEKNEPTSVIAYGLKTWPDNSKLACLEDARAVGDIILSYRAERLPIVSFDIIGDRDSRLGQCLGRDLSDRVSLVDGETGLNRDFFIEQIAHKIPLGGLFHITTFGCEAVPAPADSPFTFDDATNGKFGTGKFASMPLDEPTGIFIFDHATQGKFGTGKFAT